MENPHSWFCLVRFSNWKCVDTIRNESVVSFYCIYFSWICSYLWGFQFRTSSLTDSLLCKNLKQFGRFWVFIDSDRQLPQFALVSCAFQCIAESRLCSNPIPGWGREEGLYSFPVSILSLGFCFCLLVLCLKLLPSFAASSQFVIRLFSNLVNWKFQLRSLYLISSWWKTACNWDDGIH